MKLNIKIIAITLSIMSFSFIISMDQTMYYEQPSIQKYAYILKRTPESEAEKLATFAHTEHVTETDVAFALGAARWLVKQRTVIVENKTWMAFVNNFTQKMEEHNCPCPCIPHKKLDTVIRVIKKTTSTAKPEENFSQILVDEMQKAIRQIEQEVNNRLV